MTTLQIEDHYLANTNATEEAIAPRLPAGWTVGLVDVSPTPSTFPRSYRLQVWGEGKEALVWDVLAALGLGWVEVEGDS